MLLHERSCMIVIPHLYQHEILFCAHNALAHKGISKVVARHTWPGIRSTVGQYVRQCLTCQQVRDKPGDVRFHLKNHQSGYLVELVQYDHMKLYPGATMSMTPSPHPVCCFRSGLLVMARQRACSLTTLPI